MHSLWLAYAFGFDPKDNGRLAREAVETLVSPIVRLVTVVRDIRHIAHSVLSLFSHLLLADGVPFMPDDTASANLHHILEHRSKKAHKQRSTVLFRRGEQASGMFVVLSGKVSLDLGVDSALCRTYGPGALIGLPSTLSRQNYSMTATVTEDAELGFWSPDALDSLLRQRPDLCQLLLAILGMKVAEGHEMERASLIREKQPPSDADRQTR